MLIPPERRASCICSFVGEGLRCGANQNGLGGWSKARDRRYTIGPCWCPLVIRVVLDATANRSGEGSQSTFGTTTSTLSSVNERRVLTLTMHITRFPLPYRRNYAVISTGAVFLRHTSTASGAMHVLFDHNCAAQLHNMLHTVYSDEVSSSPPSFPAGSKLERRNKYQLLGYAVLSPLYTVSSSVI